MSERQTDFELLRDFVRRGDQPAFADVVRRHLDLVYATALRKTEEEGAAEEVAQNVFAALAKKAWQFAPDDSLPAWLYRTTLLEAKEWLRGELRRRRREQTAAELGTTMKTPDEQTAFHALVPLLDEALLSLREKDRTALLLRFYESQSLRDVGASLGVGEDAAQKRVAAALEKLASFFQRRGYRTATIAAATAALQHTATAAPAFMAASVAQAAVAAAPAATGLTVLLVHLLALTKLQKALLCAAFLVVPVVWHWWQNPHEERQVSTGAEEREAYSQPALETAVERNPPQIPELLPPIEPPATPAVEHTTAGKTATARLTGLVDLPGFKAAFLEVAYTVTNDSPKSQIEQETVRTNYLFLKEGDTSIESLWMTQMTLEVLQVDFSRGEVKGREDGKEVHYVLGPPSRSNSNIRLHNVRLRDVLMLYGACRGRTVLCHPALKETLISLEISARDQNAAATAVLVSARQKEDIMNLVNGRFELVFPATKQVLFEINRTTGAIPAPAKTGEELIPTGAIQLRDLDLPQALVIYGELIGRKLVQTKVPARNPIFLVNQTPLSKAELVYAFDILFWWQGWRVEFVGKDSFKVVPLKSR